MAAVRAIFFDLGETLVDGSGIRESILSTCHQLAEGTPGLDASSLFAANQIAWQQFWPEVEERWALGILDDETVGLEAWRRTVRAIGISDESLIRRAREIHLELARRVLRPFPGVVETLELLASRFPLAVITNGASETQRDKLRMLGIGQHVAVVVVSAEVGVVKPDPSIFRIGLDELGLAAEDVWHIGDSFSLDVAGASAAGLTAVWLNRDARLRRPNDATPDYEIRDLAELPGLLRVSERN